MAVDTRYNANGFAEVRCLHADTKPTDAKNGAHLKEIDTGKEFAFDIESKTWKCTKNAEYRMVIASAPTTGNDIGDSLYDPATTKWWMWNGSAWAEQFQMASE